MIALGALRWLIEGTASTKALYRRPAAWCCLVLMVGALTGANTEESFAGPVVDSCPASMEPRRALPDDVVCATLESRARIAAENARAPLLWVPGPYGPKTCANGFVWREATASDLTCVTPAVRSGVFTENFNPQLAPGQ